MDLIKKDGTWDDSISQQMIDLKYAVRVEESYVSKMDNEARQSTKEFKPSSHLMKHMERE